MATMKIRQMPVRPTGEPASWSLRWLQKRCRRYRDELTRPGVPNVDAVRREIRDYWPRTATGDWRGEKPEDIGGENEFAGKGAWLWCHAQMIRLLGKTEENTPKPATKEAFEALGKAAKREPLKVVMSDGAIRQIYPKSYPALCYLDALKVDLALVTTRRALELEIAEQASEQFLAPLVLSLGHQVFAWIVTHPDVGLPFPLAGETPDPPEWTLFLTPEDLYRLAAGHLEVNRRRLELTASINPTDGTPSSLPIEGWVAAYAHEQGLSSFEVLDRWSLGELYAQAVSSAIAAKEAERAAKEDAPPPVPSPGDQSFAFAG